MWQLGYFECSSSKGYMQWLSVLDGNANSVDLVGKGSLPIEEPLRPSSNEYVDIASLLKRFYEFLYLVL